MITKRRVPNGDSAGTQEDENFIHVYKYKRFITFVFSGNRIGLVIEE